MTPSEEPTTINTSQNNLPISDNSDLDAIYSVIGEYGRYQKILIWLVCVPIWTITGLQGLKQVLISETPNHWCRPPAEFEMASNISEITKKHFSIPMEIGNSQQLTYSMCEMYDINYTQLVHLIIDGEISNSNVSSWPKMSCKYGWIYDTTYFLKTVVTEWDLVCRKAILPTVAQAIYFLGASTGVLLFGYMADRTGRRISVLACIIVSVFSETMSGLAPEYISWTVLRFLAGLCEGSLYQMTLMLCIEIVGPKNRSFVTVLSCICYSVGILILSGIAYSIRNFRVLSLVTSVPFVLLLINWRYLPETPRWLLTQSKAEEAIKVYEHVASVNKMPFPDHLRTFVKKNEASKNEMERNQSKPGQKLSITLLFKSPAIRSISIFATICCFANQTVYEGLSIYCSKMHPNPYLGFALAAAVELPSHVALIWIVELWTRRWSLCTIMTLGGISCVLTPFVPEDYSTIILTLYLGGKLAMATTYLLVYAYAVELYPTEIRGIGLGLSQYMGIFGFTAVTFVDYLGLQSLSLPLVIQGVLVIVGGVAVLALPETLHQGLPQTIEDCEMRRAKVTNKAFFTCCIRKSHNDDP